MDVFAAIAQMRQLSKAGLPFSFAYMSYSTTTGISEGLKRVNRAVLRQQQEGNDTLLSYYDLDANQNRKCNQLLLMEFNNIKLTLQ